LMTPRPAKGLRGGAENTRRKFPVEGSGAEVSETKILLSERDIPRQWYNIAADLDTPLKPPLHPGTKQPVGPDDLAPLFPMALIEQEVSTQRWIDIPEEIIDIYRLWRPTPLYRARRLE